ncbi:MAG: hypothetical protein QGH06_05130 [Lutibacter sp.]|jgi:hypothetical protein|nr:hypothetical protein [Lutibacter sp.]
MKVVLTVVLVLIMGLLGTGYYLKSVGIAYGEVVIGIGVLTTAFVLMPLFIFYRYKDKDLQSFRFRNVPPDGSKEDTGN